MPKYDERGLTVSGLLVVVFYVWFVLLRFKIRVYEMIPKNWTSFMYVSLFKIHAKLFIACKFVLKQGENLRFLENKVPQKLKFSKIIKECAPRMIFFNGKVF